MYDKQQWLDEVAGYAVKLCRATGAPEKLAIQFAGMLTAQGAVESKWGAKPVGKANFFGIKRANRHSLFSLQPTTEFFSKAQIDEWNLRHPDRPCRDVTEVSHDRFRVTIDDQFADYVDLQASCQDYVYLITQTQIYAPMWNHYILTQDFGTFAKTVLAKYATASYGALVLQIAAQPNVQAAIGKHLA